MVHVLIMFALVGFLCWLVLQIPMPAPFRNIIIGIMCVFAVIWALQTLGLNTGLPRLRLN